MSIDEKTFHKLRDQSWFETFIAEQYYRIAIEFGCVPQLSTVRLVQAHDLFWKEADEGKFRNMPENTEMLDQFKLSAYLCFWLRRINPIQDVIVIEPGLDIENYRVGDPRVPKRVEDFLLYGNEICAFLLAIRLAQYATSSALLMDLSDDVHAISKVGAEIVNFEYGYTMEAAKILKHKNISAQGLYLTLFTLFGRGIRVSVSGETK